MKAQMQLWQQEAWHNYITGVGKCKWLLQTIACFGYTRAIKDDHDADAGQIVPLDDAAESERWGFYVLIAAASLPRV